MWKTQTIFQSELQRPHRVCTPSSLYSGLAEIVKLGKPYPRTFDLYSLGISNWCLNKLDKRKQSHRFNDFSKIITCQIRSHFQTPCAQHFLAILASISFSKVQSHANSVVCCLNLVFVCFCWWSLIFLCLNSNFRR